MISIFLPIRKGSKRILNKNFKSLPGYKYGLTEIKIKHFKKLRSKLSNLKVKVEFVVSTDSKKIFKIFKNINWINLHWRNKEAAADDSLAKLIKQVPKICSGNLILWTHVTSPFFNDTDYIHLIKRFINKSNNKKIKSMSAFSADKIQKFIFREDGKWISHNYKKKKWPRTQDLLNSYIVNSAAFISNREVYIKKKDRLCNNPMPILSRPSASFDVDDINDFRFVKKYLKKSGTRT